VPLPAVARDIINEYLQVDRSTASGHQPLFVVRCRTRGGTIREARMTSPRVWKIVKVLVRRVGVPELHPHAFRHGCGVELLRRSHGNLRAVQEHLRHADIQTTTIYTRLTVHDLQEVVRVFDQPGTRTGIRVPSPQDENTGAANA
jgi:site-specific recombinase XerD